MFKMFRLIAIAYLLANTCKVYSMTLHDPNNRAEVLQRLFPETIEFPFECDQPVKFTQTDLRCEYVCEARGCRELCSPAISPTFEVQAENCSIDHVDIHSGIGWAAISKQKLDLKYGQTWIEDFIASAHFFILPSGTFEIVHVFEFTPRTLVDEHGEEHFIHAVTIYLDYKQSDSLDTIGFQLILDKNERGLKQLLYFGSNHGDMYFIKRWGLLK